jgi:MoxR-like ATPase
MTGQELEQHLQQELGRVVYGAEETIHALTIALIARGHILLEGAPGLGKTLLSRSFAATIGGSFKRIQGTADLMPADITGVHVFNPESRHFEFEPGPLFADVVLADEINRAGPKTQSALLEAMEERQVTVDKETFTLPADFLVVATQNPREFEGTYPLPESQLDRFMLAVPVSYVERHSELAILEAYNLPEGARDDIQLPTPLPTGALAETRAALADVHLSADLMTYVLDIARATRENSQVSLGLSTRGAIALTRCARIEAALGGSAFVTPDHVKRVAPWVLGHRLVLSPEAALDGIGGESIVNHVLDNVAVPH